MGSVEVTTRVERARELATLIDDQAQALAEGIAHRLDRDVGVSVLALAVRDRLMRAAERAGSADDDHHAELADDDDVRDQRDQAAGALYDALNNVRSAVRSVYGSDGERAMGIVGPSPRAPDQLHESVAALLERAPAIKMPEPLVKALQLDVPGLVHGMHIPFERLEAAMQLQLHEDDESQSTATTRYEAIGELDQLCRAGADLLVALAELAGDEPLADRTRRRFKE